jgi:hypothetical protein
VSPGRTLSSRYGTPAVLATGERVAQAKPELQVRQRVPVHPRQFSPEVIAALEELVAPGSHVHDPFARMGLRLAALCDRIGAVYTGTDIEDWPGRDRRVAVGDSTLVDTCPDSAFTVVTSPVYLNKRLADYANGPKSTTKTRGAGTTGLAWDGRCSPATSLATPAGRDGPATTSACIPRHSGTGGIVRSSTWTRGSTKGGARCWTRMVTRWSLSPRSGPGGTAACATPTSEPTTKY